MPYILKEENIEEFLRKSEMDEFEEEDFGEFYPDDYKMVDKSGMFEDFRFKLVVLESLLGKNASFVDEFKEFIKHGITWIVQDHSTYFTNITNLKRAKATCCDIFSPNTIWA